MKTWKTSIGCAAAVTGLIAGALGAGPAAAAPPEPVSGDFVFECANGVELEVVFEGKAKDIDNPGGKKSISPGLQATVTNTNDESKTLSFPVTGTVRSTTLDNGDVEYKATGSNVIIVPDPAGLYRTSGNVTFVNDAEGNEVDRFSGPGRVVDLCEELA